MSNRIEYGKYIFDDDSIFNGKVEMSNSMMFDSLVPDELTVEVVSKDTGWGKLMTVDNKWVHTSANEGYVIDADDITAFTYGDPVYYYRDDVLVGKFYMRSIERLSIDRFRLSAVSLVGLLASETHMGGIYYGAYGYEHTAGGIIADILQGYDYTIYSQVEYTPVWGWLPIASKRDNLQQVLFAVGATITKDAETGNPHITYLSTLGTPKNIAGTRIFLGSSYNYKAPATEVVVSEHGYYKSAQDRTVSLFDNTDGSGAVENLLVTFEKPCYDLAWSGEESVATFPKGANYCYVTGVGELTGKEYTHAEKVFSVPTDATGETRVVNVKNATLVSLANSINVAARVVDYETKAEEVNLGIELGTDNIKPATGIKFTDPYGQQITGLISKMDLIMSGKSKADCTVVKNYQPSHFGNNYRKTLLAFTNRTWTPPVGTETIRVIIGQGGQAGQNGYNGTAATGEFDENYEPTGTVGVGGAGGSAGSAGKVFVIDLPSPTTLTITVGAAGVTSNTEGGVGGEGGHSTVTMNGVTYTSADGEVLEAGFLDIFSGTRYAIAGRDGVRGGNGGGIQGDWQVPLSAENVEYNDKLYKGGTNGENYYVDEPRPIRILGGGGGGAAYGRSGGNGTTAEWKDDAPSTWTYGDGGNGANAIQLPDTATYGSGGAGGCGGGGGGGGGAWMYQTSQSTYRGFATMGTGGSFSKGKDGGGGFVLIYYS